MHVQVGVPRSTLVVRTETIAADLGPDTDAASAAAAIAAAELAGAVGDAGRAASSIGTAGTAAFAAAGLALAATAVRIRHRLSRCSSACRCCSSRQCKCRSCRYPGSGHRSRPASPQAAPAGQFGAHAWQVPWMQSGFALGQAAPQSPPHPSEPQRLAVQSACRCFRTRQQSKFRSRRSYCRRCRNWRNHCQEPRRHWHSN